ncbi:c-type cytochrome [Pontivivens nitratireducens]|uniref:Cytochrome c n=1 Tax=Pontivivens nitratireducens TaxID=2758038 RepID=A0A6G7VRI1_9RHOB|nr:cytochrome c [Pontibrevibacter nitratireducens]QIK42485.1 cytochrome c [Pontibrevibacter nitratireducens]
MRRAATIGAAIVALSVIGFAVLAQSESEEDLVEGLSFLGEPVAVADISAGQALYAENCASCHGAELEGQPDWRRRLDTGRMPAPPHDETGHTWHHSDRNLFIVTKGGVGAVVPGYESDMPAFEGILTDDEIADVLSYIKSTWPDRQREFQAEVSVNDKGDL